MKQKDESVSVTEYVGGMSTEWPCRAKDEMTARANLSRNADQDRPHIPLFLSSIHVVFSGADILALPQLQFLTYHVCRQESRMLARLRLSPLTIHTSSHQFDPQCHPTSSPRSASASSHPNSRSEASCSSSDSESAISPRFLLPDWLI